MNRQLSRLFVHQFYLLSTLLNSHYRFSSSPREFCLEILLQFACYQELDPTYTTLVAAVSNQKEEFIQFQKKTHERIYFLFLVLIFRAAETFPGWLPNQTLSYLVTCFGQGVHARNVVIGHLIDGNFTLHTFVLANCCRPLNLGY